MTRFLYLISFLLLFSCNNEEAAKEEVKTETMPTVDLQLYDTIHYNDQFRFLVPSEYSVSRNTIADSRLCYNDLINEEHVFVFSTPKNTYHRSLECRNIKVSQDSVFINFADEQYDSFKSKLADANPKEEYLSMVKERQTKYFRCTGLSYGFPSRKSISLRCYEGRKDYYTILYWTTANHHEKFETKEDVIMMSFDEIKKGQPES